MVRNHRGSLSQYINPSVLPCNVHHPARGSRWVVSVHSSRVRSLVSRSSPSFRVNSLQYGQKIPQEDHHDQFQEGASARANCRTFWGHKALDFGFYTRPCPYRKDQGPARWDIPPNKIFCSCSRGAADAEASSRPATGANLRIIYRGRPRRRPGA